MNWGTVTNIGLVIGLLSSLITIGDKVLARPAGTPGTGPAGTSPSSTPTAQTSKGLDVWHVEQRHVLLMLGGAILYAVTGTIVADHYASAKVGAVYLTSLTSTLTLLCGVVGGPWVGLFVGAVGYTLTGVPHLTNAASVFPFPPAYAVGDGIAGLIGGLSLIVTQGMFKSWRSLLAVEIMCAIGIIVGDFCSFAIHQSQAGHNPAEHLTVGMQSDLVCTLVLLPIALVVFGKPTKTPHSAASSGSIGP